MTIKQLRHKTQAVHEEFCKYRLRKALEDFESFRASRPPESVPRTDKEILTTIAVSQLKMILK